MKTRLSFISFSLVFVSFLFADPPNLEKIFGGVTSVINEFYNVDTEFGELKIGEYKHKIIHTYDIYGLLDNAILYDIQDPIWKKIEYQWTPEEKVSEKTLYRSDGSLLSKIIYSYNTDGLLETEKVFRENGTLVSKKKYVYDDENRVDSIISYDSNDKLIDKTNYYYQAIKSGYQILEIESIILSIGEFVVSKKLFTFSRLDHNENWTICLESEEVTKFEKTYFEPKEIIIRKIEYK